MDGRPPAGASVAGSVTVSVADTAAQYDKLGLDKSRARVPSRPMPVRATKRGAERTPLDGDYDVLVCGASFAGLAVARELAGLGRAGAASSTATRSASARPRPAPRPTDWLLEPRPRGLDAPDVRRPRRPHAAHDRRGCELPWTFSTFDYPELCGLLWEQCDARVRDREGRGPPSDRRRRSRRRSPTAASVTAPLVVDALGWRRVLPATAATSRPTRRSPAGSRSIRGARRDELEIWIDRGYVPAGYGWSFPAARRGPGRRRLVRPPPPRQGADRAARRGPRPRRRSATRATGSRTGSARRPRTRSSSPATRPGHCLPLTAEGIRTAFYFGIACGARAAPASSRAARPARRRCATTRRSRRPRWKFEWMLRMQRLCPGCRRGCSRDAALAAGRATRSCDWSFGHYLRIAHPAFALGSAGAPAIRAGASRPRPSSARSGTCRRAAGRRRAPAPGDRRLLEAEDAEPVEHDRRVSWPVIVAAATPPAPIALTATSAVNT